MLKQKKAMKLLPIILALLISVSCQSKQPDNPKPEVTEKTDVTQSIEQRVKLLVESMTVDEKIGQMVQAERGQILPDQVKEYFIGSILSGGGSSPGNSLEDWMRMCRDFQDAATSTRLGIPVLYGVDAVHGHNTLTSATIFPHNIGLGAANNPQLMSQIGEITAKEMIATGVNWNFGPCVAVSRDERWGRSYESYSETPQIVDNLQKPYITALQNNKITACAKHFAGDGGTLWGTGDSGFFIDQGETKVTREEFENIHLSVYKEAINSGVKTIMLSFSSFEGTKMHEHKELIQDVLKGEMGFKGFVVSDWEGVHQIKGKDFYGQIVSAVNAGMDMFMEPNKWKECIANLKRAVDNGDIKIERINDAVSRILTVKMEMGLFENPLGSRDLAATKLGEESALEVARKAVKESLVLLKNNNNTLPLKKDGKVLLLGTASNNVGIQCGGWTRTWQGDVDKYSSKWVRGSTILEGFRKLAKENGGEIFTDIKDANKADVVVAVIGEIPYAEGNGDDEKLGLYDGMALEDNKKVLEDAKASGLPVVTILLSGRPRIVTEELQNWEAFVAAWLPGSEGDAIADVIYGNEDFKGKLPVTWPKSVGQIPINVDNMDEKQPLFPLGFGLKYKE